jgi:hypothetical protein
MPEAIATLFQGNREALIGFTDAEAVQLLDLLTRLIENLDRIASGEVSYANPNSCNEDVSRD